MVGMLWRKSWLSISAVKLFLEQEEFGSFLQTRESGCHINSYDMILVK
jgi:hypothetical protein